MGVVEKVRLAPRLPETLAAPSYGVGVGDEVTVAIVTKKSGDQNQPVGQNKSNFEKLRRQTEELVAARDRVHHMIALEERHGKRIEPYVVNWLNSVDEASERVNTFLMGEYQTKTKGLQGWLAKTKTLVNPLSNKATKLEQEVVELYAKRDFTCVSPQEVSDSMISILERIMDQLRNPDTNMILVYGVGGVGKTTLIKEVFRKATEDKWFDDVVMVLDVRQNPDLGRIQKEILEKLGMDVLGDETMVGRAHRLSKRIRDKKILVILDDVWESIDLEAIGLHRVANCKILLTSRTRRAFSSDMRMQKEFGLTVLSEEES
ncbi:putative P-loop containing nucleoside triphosphate hydrolase [Rosa chinensis]|uniref:Putative P-loop containing nucleoside triphosphate hydrolase n=1 Tax=Rosa chinensis TaxID=74649 RepID=A0A2P6RPE2_ROSCH|nr:putative P-loop containing nucleoside triphosphate hydrolase [Rosa chinensis]